MPVPARSRRQAGIGIRNWLSTPGKWTAASDRPWLRPEATAGSAEGFAHLPVTIDSADLAPGARAEGTVTITDQTTGKRHPVKVNADVGRLYEFPEQVSMNLAPRQTARRKLALVNLSGEALSWKLTPRAEWLSASPAGGTIPPAGAVFVDVAAAPAGTAAATRTGKLRLTVGDTGGEDLTVTAHVIPPYDPPRAPTGKSVWLCDAVGAGLAPAEHVIAGIGAGERNAPWWGRRPQFTGHPYEAGKTPDSPFKMRSGSFTRGWWVRPLHRTTFDIAGKGFAAFSAAVGLADRVRRGEQFNAGAVVQFEVHVDGRLSAWSGLVGADDEPRLLVVTGLRNARTVTFVTRRDTDDNDDRALCCWGNPKFYSLVVRQD